MTNPDIIIMTSSMQLCTVQDEEEGIKCIKKGSKKQKAKGRAPNQSFKLKASVDRYLFQHNSNS